MALDATIGSPNANSYVTVAEANDYFSDRLHADIWKNFENQASALVTASQLLDWYVKWKGVKSTSIQSMQWPRKNVIRSDGTIVADDIIPSEVKIAVYELALSSLASDRTADNPMAGIEQVKAGSLFVKADSGDFHTTSVDVIPEKVRKIISDLYSSGSLSVVRLVRA